MINSGEWNGMKSEDAEDKRLPILWKSAASERRQYTL